MRSKSNGWVQNLHGSWAQIFSFLALIIIAYFVFTAIFYWSDANWKKSIIWTVCAVLVLATISVLAMEAKGSDHIILGQKYSSKTFLWVEYGLFALGTIVLLVVMWPTNQFFNVLAHQKEIKNNYTESIEKSKQMFVEYEQYSEQRISNLKQSYDISGHNPQHINNIVDALRLQLLSDNYDSLKTCATSWISSTSDNATVWNPFLLGNAKMIKKELNKWNQELESMSQYVHTSEKNRGLTVSAFDSNNPSIIDANNGIDELSGIYKAKWQFSGWSIIVFIISFSLFFLPYFIQNRFRPGFDNVKTTWSGTTKRGRNDGFIGGTL